MPAQPALPLASEDNGGRQGPSPATISPLSSHQDGVGETPPLLLPLSGWLQGWGVAARPGALLHAACHGATGPCASRHGLARSAPSLAPLVHPRWAGSQGRSGQDGPACPPPPPRGDWMHVLASSRLVLPQASSPMEESGLAPHSLHGGLHWRLGDTGSRGSRGLHWGPSSSPVGPGVPQPPCDFRDPPGWAPPGPGSHF